MTIETLYGEYKLTGIEVKKGKKGQGIGIQLWCPDGPLARITTELMGVPKLKENQAYVDINDSPWAEEFIEKNGLGKFAGVIQPSGWCLFPLYEFDLEAIEKFKERLI